MFVIPKDVTTIINTFYQHGFSAYMVGGCVRDLLAGITPSDWDITTSAKPEQIKALFEKTVDTGIRHGTVTVLIGNTPYEVTTYRIDGAYENNRKPLSVEFTDNIIQDLARRDFTINAMAYNEQNGLVDPFGGQDDMRAQIICCVGEPDVRFTEDALRMLRAVRFHAKTGFAVDLTVLDSICKNAHLIKNISLERIRDELNKILLSNRIMSIRMLYDTGLLKYFLPELCTCFETEQHIKYHLYDVGTHTLHVTQNVPADLVLRYSALLHDVGKPAKKTTDQDGVDHFKGHGEVSVTLSRVILRRLRLDNKSIDKILRLIKYHDREIVATKKAVKRCVFDVGEDIFLQLLDLKRGDALGQNLVYTKQRLGHYDELERIYYESKADNEAFCIKDLAVDGNDLKKLGLSGKQVGNVLNHLLSHVLERPADNEKELLLKIVEKNQNLWLN